MHLVAGARGAEAAIGAGDDALAPDDTGEAHDALRHQFRMLDEMDAVRHHAGYEDLVVGQLHLLPDRPLVLVARVGGLDQVGRGADLKHQVDEVLQLEVVHARRDVGAVAGVEAHRSSGMPRSAWLSASTRSAMNLRQSSIVASVARL